ncbi:MAG: DUF1566 domain-containing protein [Epsilonproteobacteria bacterium]|nr:DUF1566 domain-containing protein [Campylobacterota bacterium]
MKKIILLFLFSWIFTLNLFAGTDIYFGNGVWNSKKQAEESRLYFDEFIIQKEIIKNDPILVKKYEVKLAYNWGQGMMTDVLETFYQLKEAGQVNDLHFFTVVYALTKGNIPVTLAASAAKALYEPLNRDWEQGNVDEMWEKYYNESFKLSHRVLLVSHSQGNLFANRIYEIINPTEYKKYFANLQVASPANEIKATKGDYVTLVGDPIINPIPGSMSGNANGEPGYAFIEAYLMQSDPLQKIINNLTTLLPTIESTVSQWEKETESEEGAENYRVTVEHSFDENVVLDEETFPFKLSGYIYQVPDTNGDLYYVKASFGGERILSNEDTDLWEAEEHQFYKLAGTDPIEFIEGSKYSIPEYSQVLKTGQIKCYNYHTYKEEVCTEEHMGQDGYYSHKGLGLDRNFSTRLISSKAINRNVYEDYIVSNNISKLEWQHKTRGYTFSSTRYSDLHRRVFSDAKEYCKNLVLDGSQNWRLPSLVELQTIIDYGKNQSVILLS